MLFSIIIIIIITSPDLTDPMTLAPDAVNKSVT
jgi:hypothetical protein